MNKRICLLIISFLLFLFLFRSGIHLALSRGVDNDEFYTAVSSVDRLDYRNILTGEVSEGNNSPLFYSSQKFLWSILKYQIPETWQRGHWEDFSRDRFYLRLNSIFCMSLMIVVIFYFFYSQYSPWAGLLSLFLSLSSYMVWFYWTQGRPYAMWMLLTSAQLLIVLYCNRIRDEHASSAHPHIKQQRFQIPLAALSAVHLLLSLTSIFGFAQVLIVSVLTWIFFDRRWKKYFLLTVVPCALSAFYYIKSPKYNWWFSLTPDQLLRECLSRDRFYVIGIYLLCFLLFLLGKRFNSLKTWVSVSPLKGRIFGVACVLMIAAAGVVLFAFKLIESRNPAHAGFSVSSRYFVFLTAMGIISTTFFSIESIRSLGQRWWLQWLVAGGIGYLLIHRAWKLLPVIQGIYPGYFGG